MRIVLSYQPQLLVPPFAYAAVMNIEIEEDSISVDFMLEYVGRDNISDDELKADGFTRNDDFNWSGNISVQWKSDIEQLASLTYENDPHHEIYLHIEANGQKLGFPKEIDNSELVFQELMQAVLEKAEIEAPLLLVCKFADEIQELKWEFSKRAIQINDKYSTNWVLGRQLIKDIYALDFESLKSQQKPAINSINIGDGVWYAIKDNQIIGNLKKQIDDLTS